MKKKICFVVAVPITAHAFLKDHMKMLSEEYDIHLAASINSEEDVKGLAISGWHRIEIERGISLWRDLKAVWQAWRYFRKMKFDAVHSVTPKAGLVTALAGWLAGIKHRTHIFTGQVWATRKGVMRWLLKSLDKLIVLLDNHILVDGRSQRSFLIQEGVLKDGQAEVFGEGSICGVNIHRFVPDESARIEIRKQIGIPDGTLVYIFLGRLNHDKGIGELYDAFNRLAGEKKDIFLLLVGADEENYISKLVHYPYIEDGRNFYFYGNTPKPEKVLNAGDIFVLPTYREGFGMSVLESACIGLPSITTNAYGVLDASVEGVTGLRCKVGDAESLYDCMQQFYDCRELVAQMGVSARKRILENFSGELLTKFWVDFYRRLLG